VLTYDYAQVHSPATMTCSERKPSLLDTCIAADERGRGSERQREGRRGSERGREGEGGIKSVRESVCERVFDICQAKSLGHVHRRYVCVCVCVCALNICQASPLDTCVAVVCVCVCVRVLSICQAKSHVHRHWPPSVGGRCVCVYLCICVCVYLYVHVYVYITLKYTYISHLRHTYTYTYTRMRLDFSPFIKTKMEHLSPCSRLWG
jgi:hypothetical protein